MMPSRSSYPRSIEHATTLTDPKEEVLRRISDPEHLCAGLGLRARRRPAGKVLVDCPACGSNQCAVRHVADRGIVLWRCPKCDVSGNAFHLIAKVRRLDIRRDFPTVLAVAARLAGMDPEVVLGRRRTTVERPRVEDEVDFGAVLAALPVQPAAKPRRSTPVTAPMDDDLAAVFAAMDASPCLA